MMRIHRTYLEADFYLFAINSVKSSDDITVHSMYFAADLGLVILTLHRTYVVSDFGLFAINSVKHNEST